MYPPEDPAEVSWGHGWECCRAVTGNSHRSVFLKSRPPWGTLLSPGGSAGLQFPTTERSEHHSTPHGDHLRGHWQKNKNKNTGNLLKPECFRWKSERSFLWSPTCLCRELGPERLWSAAAVRGAGCGCRTPGDWAAERSVWWGCQRTERRASWRPEL